MRLALPGLQTKVLVPQLTVPERKFLKRYLPNQGRRTGFRLFTKCPEFKETMVEQMAEEEERQREARKQEGSDYIPPNIFLLKEEIKVDAWKRLSEAERDEWRNAAQTSLGGDEMTE